MSHSESLFRRWFRRGSVRKPGRSFFHKPRLECLEDRALLANFLVTNLDDSGRGSLRSAIIQANSQPGDDTIAFASNVNGTIHLLSELPELSSNIHILDFTVPGDAGVTVRRADDMPNFRIFTITEGSVVAISGLTVSNGRVSSGGGIRNEGTLTLTDSTVSGNRAQFGGGIANVGTLKLTNSTVSGNSLGIFDFFSGPEIYGAGIGNSGTLTLTNSTVSGNIAVSIGLGTGGGIANLKNTLFNRIGKVTLTNSTVSGNSTNYEGGGIYNLDECTVTLINSTVSGNSADYQGGGIANEGTLILRNTIVANSAGGDVANFATILGSHNLVEDGSIGGDTISGDPKLGPLANNGGRTKTHALLAGSIAINAGSNTLIPDGVTTDQRGPGFARISGGKVDIGAFETQSTLTAFQNGVTLFILGDREANRIAIADTREGGISVAFDDGESHHFTGVQRIFVETFAGDDEVTATFNNPPDIFEFRADLGAGDDRLTISGFDPQPDPPRQTVIFDIDAGAGDDTIVFDFDHLHFRGQFQVSVEGGAGNDRLSFATIIPCILPESELRIGLAGGAGDDQLAVRMGESSREPAEIEGNLRLDLNGGVGDDLVKLDFGHNHFSGQVLIAAHGGAGNDQMAIKIQPCILPEGELHIRFDGGAGNDQLAMRFHSPSEMHAEIDGVVRLNVHGGAGDDEIVLDMDNLNIHGAMLVDMRGGAGNDVMESFIIPCLLPAGRGQFLFDGGAGDDRIAARFELGEHCEGALDIRVLGGQGDDDLTLALFDAEHLTFLATLVDGGRGHDVAHVTRNVRVANCEEIFFLDDPT